MRELVTVAISALLGAVLLGVVSATNTFLALPMGALLGAVIAIAILAFPQDLVYRERRVWPPRAPTN